MGKVRTKLSRLERLFIECYLDCFDVGEAAERSGCIPHGDTPARIRRHHDQQGRRLMRRKSVGDEVERRLSNALRGVGVEKGKILHELCSLSFFDPASLFAEDGSPLPMSEIDPRTRACIAGIEVEEKYQGSGASRVFVGWIRKYKITSKTEPLKLLGEHLRLWGERDVEKQKDRLGEIVEALRSSAGDGGNRSIDDPAKLLEGVGTIVPETDKSESDE